MAPGDDAVELVVRGERTPSSSLLGRVLDPDGKPVRPGQIWARRTDGVASVGNPSWSEDERFTIGPMFSGEYELAITVQGFPTLNLPAFAIDEREEHDLGDIALPRPGRTQLTLRALDGAALPPRLMAVLWHGRYGAPLTSTDGVVYESDALFPGSYRFGVSFGGAAPTEPVSVEIRPGETTVAELRLAQGRSVRFEIAAREGERFPARVDLEIRGAAGSLAFAQQGIEPQRATGRELMFAFSSLPFGRFDYVVRRADGLTTTGEFEVVPGSDAQQLVPILLARSTH